MYFTRYAFIGVLSTLIHYLLLILLVEFFGVAAVFSTAIGALAGAVFGYVGNAIFTFHQTSALSIRQFSQFLIIALLTAILNSLVIWLTTQIGLHYFFGQILATLAIFPVGFLFNKSWTYAI